MALKTDRRGRHPGARGLLLGGRRLPGQTRPRRRAPRRPAGAAAATRARPVAPPGTALRPALHLARPPRSPAQPAAATAAQPLPRVRPLGAIRQRPEGGSIPPTRASRSGIHWSGPGRSFPNARRDPGCAVRSGACPRKRCTRAGGRPSAAHLAGLAARAWKPRPTAIPGCPRDT